MKDLHIETAKGSSLVISPEDNPWICSVTLTAEDKSFVTAKFTRRQLHDFADQIHFMLPVKD